MKYLVIDTNIWERVISQGKPGCEITHLDDLCKLVDESKLTLLIPEVIQLELAKRWRSFTEDVTVKIGMLEKELEPVLRKPFWTEIEDVQRSLRDFLADQKTQKVNAATERFEKVQLLLTSPRIVLLPFTPEINFRGRKRLMAGRMPKPESRAHADACILESLADFFSSAGPADEQELCFCSENVADFGLVAKEGYIIHPLHKDDLPAATKYCISLSQVVAFFKSEEKAVVPSPADVEEALQQRIEDEVEAELEMEEEQKSDEMCAEPNCYALRYLISRYCHSHYQIHLSRLSPDQRVEFDGELEKVLNTLTFREREIVKLRWGIGDGYVYTPAECGRIFRITPQQAGRIEARAIRKLEHPARRRTLDAILP